MTTLKRIPYWYLLLLPTAALYFGAFLNVFVMAVNGGQMPVLWPGGCGVWPDDGDLIHTCMTHATHLKFLCDWINLPLYIASPGDMFIFLSESFYLPCLYAWLALVLRDYMRRRA